MKKKDFRSYPSREKHEQLLSTDAKQAVFQKRGIQNSFFKSPLCF
jgi:hypothetical protein